MSPLGLFITTVGAIGGPGMLGDPGGAAVKPDPFWECATSCCITPIPVTGADNNDMWDLDANLDYMPQLAATHAAEGFWEPDGNSDIQIYADSPCS